MAGLTAAPSLLQAVSVPYFPLPIRESDLTTQLPPEGPRPLGEQRPFALLGAAAGLVSLSLYASHFLAVTALGGWQWGSSTHLTDEETEGKGARART